MTNANDFVILQDGTQADPGDVSKGEDGVMRSKNGVAVSLGSDGKPQTVGRAALENGNVLAASGATGNTNDQKKKDDMLLTTETVKPNAGAQRPEPPRPDRREPPVSQVRS